MGASAPGQTVQHPPTQSLPGAGPLPWVRLSAISRDITLAEEVGFEPTVTLRPQRFSRPSDSSALALLQQDFRVAQPKIKLNPKPLDFAARDGNGTASR